MTRHSWRYGRRTRPQGQSAAVATSRHRGSEYPARTQRFCTRKEGTAVTDMDAQYVKNELLEMLSGAMDAGLAEYVGFDITDGYLTAETYDPGGEIAGKWSIEVTVTPAD